ncbi:MAG: acetyl-CoA carboxylase biotin carboxyl carrier protein [Blautia sp.]|jgi:acetyl-CoA carboxylase biotin carboxyl carrier protein
MEFDQILTLIREVSDSHLTQFSLKQGDLDISMKTDKHTGKMPAVVLTETAGEPLKEAKESAAVQEEILETEHLEETAGNVVKAPLVGTFYSSASPDMPPFVKEGDRVEKGQVLGIVEAMKLMNEIESEFTGTVVKILVDNEQVVEYGQPLFVIA